MTKLTPARIAALSAALTAALAAHHAAAEREADARATLATREAELTLRPEGIPGSNEPQRKAWLYAETSPEREAVERLAAVTREARLALEQARAAWDAMRYTVRLMEVARGKVA